MWRKTQNSNSTPIKVGFATRSQYASSGPKAEGVPKAFRGDGDQDKFRQGRYRVPTALLVRVQLFRNDLYKAVI